MTEQYCPSWYWNNISQFAEAISAGVLKQYQSGYWNNISRVTEAISVGLVEQYYSGEVLTERYHSALCQSCKLCFLIYFVVGCAREHPASGAHDSLAHASSFVLLCFFIYVNINLYIDFVNIWPKYFYTIESYQYTYWII